MHSYHTINAVFQSPMAAFKRHWSEVIKGSDGIGDSVDVSI